MGAEKLIDEFVERLRTTAGTNLLAVILYGSAAAGGYFSEHSDVNLLCAPGGHSFPGFAGPPPGGEAEASGAAADERGRDAAVGGRFLHRISRYASPLSLALGRRCSQDAGSSDALASGAVGV